MDGVISLKKVLILESGAALAEIIDHLVGKNERFQVKRVLPKSVDELMQVICAFNPDFILMDDVILNQNFTKLAVFLQDVPNCQIVVLNSESNRLFLYTRNETLLQNSGDLLAVLAN